MTVRYGSYEPHVAIKIQFKNSVSQLHWLYFKVLNSHMWSVAPLLDSLGIPIVVTYPRRWTLVVHSLVPECWRGPWVWTSVSASICLLLGKSLSFSQPVSWSAVTGIQSLFRMHKAEWESNKVKDVKTLNLKTTESYRFLVNTNYLLNFLVNYTVLHSHNDRNKSWRHFFYGQFGDVHLNFMCSDPLTR